MGFMDTTRIDELLTELEAADPADAPDIADALTAALAHSLDEPEPVKQDDTPAATDTDAS